MKHEVPTAVRLSVGAKVRGWRAAFLPAQWLPTYQPNRLANDAIASVTPAACGIPVSQACASLAALPPQHGIYCYLIGGQCYAFRFLGVAGHRPASAISMLVVLRFGLVALALLLAEKFLPGKTAPLFVVIASIVALAVTPLGELGFKVVGALPTGLPDFKLPDLRVLDAVLH